MLSFDDQLKVASKEMLAIVEEISTGFGRDFILQVSQTLAQIFTEGGKVLICGNGGSLCDAQHFAEELTGRFRETRRALPAIALSDPGHLSCVANDFGYEMTFARGVEAFGKTGDLLIVLSTSGLSPNVIQACRAAKEKELKVAALLGKGGGPLKGQTDFAWIVEGSQASERIQEGHMMALHFIVDFVEQFLFKKASHVAMAKSR